MGLLDGGHGLWGESHESVLCVCDGTRTQAGEDDPASGNGAFAQHQFGFPFSGREQGLAVKPRLTLNLVICFLHVQSWYYRSEHHTW